MELKDFLMINLSSTLLNPHKQPLAGKAVHSSCAQGRTVFCCCLMLSTRYLNLVSPNPHSGRGSNKHQPPSPFTIHELIDLYQASFPSHHLACSLRRPVLHPHHLCRPPHTSPSSATSLLGHEDQTCAPHTSCRNTMDLHSSTVVFPVLFPISLLLPNICLSGVTADEKVELTFS